MPLIKSFHVIFRKISVSLILFFRISDIRSFVISSSPESASRPFVLMTTFPNKELTEEQLSLSEAKLLNALVVQKMV